jgi:hypothetical protein
MRLLLCTALMLTGLALGENGQLGSSSVLPEHEGQGSDGISITPLGGYQISFTNTLLGIMYTNDTAWSHLIGVSEVDDKLYEFDAVTGTYVTEIALAPANTEAYGTCFNPGTGIIYTNDWSDTFIYTYTGIWTTLGNPAGNYGRGMDFDGTMFWQVVSDGVQHRLLAWQPTGGTIWYDISAYVPSQVSGCTCYWDSGLYLCVTCFTSSYIYVFRIVGSTFSYIGNAALPVSTVSSFDLAYSESLDRFFWSYQESGNPHIYMFELNINVPLERDTWAGIKSCFR